MLNPRFDTRLAAATDGMERSAGQLLTHGRRIVHDHPTALALGALLGVAALATLLALTLLRRRDEDDQGGSD